MIRNIITYTFFFVIILSSQFSLDNVFISSGLKTEYNMGFSKQSNYRIGTHNGLSSSLNINTTIHNSYNVTIDTGITIFNSSYPIEGIIYRGLGIGFLGLSGAYYFKINDFPIGIQIGSRLNYSKLNLANHFIFYPSIKSYFIVPIKLDKERSIELIIPFEYNFRKDLDLFYSFGIGINFLYTHLYF